MIKGSVMRTESQLNVEGEETEIMVEMVLMIVTMKSWISDRIGQDEAKRWWDKTKKIVEVANDWPRISIEEMK